jgi:hypothetical protein
MRYLTIAIAATVLAPVSVARATPAAQQPPAVSAAKLQQALALARLSDPEDVTVEVTLANFKAGLLNGLSKGGGAITLEAKRPGIVSKMIAGAQPIIVADVHRRIPTLWNRTAQIYARELSSDQIAGLTSFFQSTVGRKLLERSVPAIDLPTGVEDPAPPKQVELNGADMAELQKFAATDPGKVLDRVGPMVDKARDSWAEESDPEFDKALMDNLAKIMNEVASERSPDKK